MKKKGSEMKKKNQSGKEQLENSNLPIEKSLHHSGMLEF